MANQINIPIEPDLKGLLDIPPCETIRLPKIQKLKITLPSGGTLEAMTDVSKGIPNDCAYAFNLMLQLAPLLASMECLLKILKLLKPVTELLKPLTKLQPPSPQVILDFTEAVGDVLPCLLIPTPANILPFIHDLLCLIIKFLNCFLGQMKTLRGLIGGLTIQLDAARADGNLALVQSLECAKENAQLQAQHFTNAIEPIGVILDLAGGLFEMAGAPKVSIPAMADASSLEAMDDIIATMDTTITTLKMVASALPGGPC